MKSLQYTLGIMFGLFLTITCKQVFYSRYNLENSVTTFYTHEANDVPLVTCALMCSSTEGCSYFYWHNRSCLIVNATAPDNNSVNTTSSIYVDDVLKDNCNLDGYDATFGGVLCVRVYGTAKMNWTDAKTTCEQDGGQLLVMRTSVFYLKLEALKSLEPSVYREHWIGGNDLTTEGEFTWIDGSDVTTEGWQIDQPDNANGDEHCLQFKSLQFNDNKCSNRRYFFCEKPLV